MKIKVACYSKTGNTMKVAEAIAEKLNITADKVSSKIQYEDVDLLFLGGAIYASKLDETLIGFIDSLTADKVKKVAVFGTYLGDNVICEKIKELVKNRDIEVLDECFSCKGKAFLVLNRNHPSKEELKGAVKFAESISKSIS